MTCSRYPVFLTLLYDGVQSCFPQNEFSIRRHLPAGPLFTCLVRVLKSYDAKTTLNEPCGKAGNLEIGVNAEAPPKEIRVTPTHTTLKGKMAEDVIRTIVCREVVPAPKSSV
jgi:hypothetical protein